MAHFVIPAQNKTYSHSQVNGSDKKKGVMDKAKHAIHDTKHEESSWFEEQYQLLQKKKKERQQLQRTKNMQKKNRHVKKWDKVQHLRSQRQLEVLEQISMAMQQPQQQQKQQMQRQDQSNTGSNPRQARGQNEGSGCSRSGSNEAAFDNSAVVHKKDADDGNNKEVLTLINERRSINKEH